jgi:hypothetical protein
MWQGLERHIYPGLGRLHQPDAIRTKLEELGIIQEDLGDSIAWLRDPWQSRRFVAFSSYDTVSAVSRDALNSSGGYDVACNTLSKRHDRRQHPCAKTSRRAAESRTSARSNLGTRYSSS